NKQGGFTTYFQNCETMSVYDAAMAYKDTNTPLVVLVGKEYGNCSSRDWAAKGTSLVGGEVVVAESYETIHRSNLIGMGILPLQYVKGEGAATHGLTGREVYSFKGISAGLKPRQLIDVIAKDPETGKEIYFKAKSRLNS